MRTFLTAALAATLSMPAMAQTCDDDKVASAPASRFKQGSGETVTDSKTGLTWLRCGLGMRWDGASCTGQTLTYDWHSAQRAIEELNRAKRGGRSDWRLPTAAELQSIVETQCFKPAINLDVFPYTPESGFWTDTEAAGFNPRAMIIHFIHGGEYVANKNQSWRVRPVAD